MRCFALLFCLILSFPAAAQISGADQPAFQTALQTWLTGDDATALPAMSALANDGNRAAQIFLGQIEQLPALHAHLTATLDRADRIALLREKKGLSGTNWLNSAAADTPLAAALHQIREYTTIAPALPALLEAGEARSVIFPLLTLVNQGGNEGVTALLLAFHPTIADLSRAMVISSHRYLRTAILEGYAPPDIDPERVSELGLKVNALGTLPLSEQLLWPTKADYQTLATASPERDALIAALDDSAAMAPLRATCAATCPDSGSACILALMVIGQYGPPLFMAGLSPIESLVSTQTYRASPRLPRDVLATIAPRADLNANRDIFSTLDQCTVAAVFPAQ